MIIATRAPDGAFMYAHDDGSPLREGDRIPDDGRTVISIAVASDDDGWRAERPGAQPIWRRGATAERAVRAVLMESCFDLAAHLEAGRTLVIKVERA